MGANYKLLKQIDFSGGMNAETPDALSSDTQLRRIVNLLPSEDGDALVLRPSFESYPNIPTGALSSADRIISIFPFKGWSSDEAIENNQTNIWQNDNLLIAYSDGTNTIIRRFVLSVDNTEQYPLGKTKITDEMVWTDAGTNTTNDIINTGSGMPSFEPYTILINNSNIIWLNNPNDLSNRNKIFMDDYWVSETVSALYGDGTSDKMGENDSEWIGESWAFASTAVDSTWADPAGTTQARAFDTWAETITIRNHINMGYLNMRFPYQLNNVDTQTTGITQNQPRPQTVTFRYKFPEANTSASLLFSKASTLDNAIRYVVEYKPKSGTTWTAATKINGQNSPVVCYTQETGMYGYETVNDIEYIKVPFTVPTSEELEIRITALPSETLPSAMLYEGSLVYLKVG